MPFRVRQQTSYKHNYLRREPNTDDINWTNRNQAASFKTKKGAEDFVRFIIAHYPTVKLQIESYGS